MTPGAFTAIVRIPPENVDHLAKFLKAIGDDIDHNQDMDFSRLRTVHFLKWVVLPVSDGFPAQLAFESNFDGSLDDHLTDLWLAFPEALKKIYAHCVEQAVTWDQRAFSSYLVMHRLPAAAFYIGVHGETVATTRNDRRLCIELQKELDRLLKADATPAPRVLFTALKLHIRTNHSSLLCAPSPEILTIGTGGFTLILLAVMAVVVVGSGSLIYSGFAVAGLACGLFTLGFLVLLSAILAVAAWMLYNSFRTLEKQDAVAWKSPKQVFPGIPEREDWQVQNPMTHLVRLKPGQLRRRAISAVLWAINLLARTTFNRGSLGGIPTIHFARWVLIDDRRRVIFFSNYDGSWESYLGDFILRAGVGLTGIWSNTEGFPPTNNLVRAGSDHADAFKKWTRNHQVHTQIWYSAYPNSSIANRTNCRTIRNFLHRSTPSDAEVRLWLKLF